MLFSPAKSQPSGNEPLRFLLTNDVARRIFSQIFRLRRVRFGQLLDSDPSIGRDELKEHLDSLVKEELVGAAEVPVEDFQTYYVTQTGLATERRLRRLQTG